MSTYHKRICILAPFKNSFFQVGAMFPKLRGVQSLFFVKKGWKTTKKKACSRLTYTKPSVWCRSNTTFLSNSIPEDAVPENLNLKSFDKDINHQIDLCKCDYCNDIYRRPICLKTCLQ